MTGTSRFLTGRVTCFATHDGIPAVARSMRLVLAAVLLWLTDVGDTS